MPEKGLKHLAFLNPLRITPLQWRSSRRVSQFILWVGHFVPLWIHVWFKSISYYSRIKVCPFKDTGFQLLKENINHSPSSNLLETAMNNILYQGRSVQVLTNLHRAQQCFSTGSWFLPLSQCRPSLASWQVLSLALKQKQHFISSKDIHFKMISSSSNLDALIGDP